MEENPEIGLDRNKRPLRSINNRQPSYIRFFNTTQRHVQIYWLDSKGKPVLYSDLYSYEQWVDVNTFVTHPWIFVDEETGDRYIKINSTYFVFELNLKPDQNIFTINKVEITINSDCRRTVKMFFFPSIDLCSQPESNEHWCI